MRIRFTTGGFLRVLAIWTALFAAFLLTIALLSHKPVFRAVILMSTGLVVLWIGIGGTLSRVFRDRMQSWFDAIPGSWQVKFVLFCTLLALIEEAVTVAMTNLAPLFGVPIGKAYITASANYFDVVCLHSVVVLVPEFVAWAWILSRWKIHPNVVLILYVLTGILGEAAFGGAQAFVSFGMWTFVYGLMVYLPAYCIPTERPGRTPPWWSYPAAVVFPILYAVPVALVVSHFHPTKIHFPPIKE
ncbi:MAG TPA: hypothetical protein VFJ58_21015 [Armatimonadota bacterium]|nr:hypothetical protein [Armatimonadota bacterium]